MTAPQDQFAAITNHSQEAVTAAVNTWAETVQSFAGQVGQAQLPDLTSAVDQYFSFAAKVLANQRQLAHQWASASAHMSAAVAEQAQRATHSVSAHTAGAAEAVVDDTAEAARRAADTAAVTPPGVERSGS